jgi:hypothetical protein
LYQEKELGIMVVEAIMDMPNRIVLLLTLDKKHDFLMAVLLRHM